MITAELSDFIGPSGLVSQLETALEKGTLPQAVLINGRRGSGKRTLAAALAAGLVCTGGHKPCGNCSSCKKAKTGHPDIAFADGGEKGNVTVDDVRELRRQAFVLPNDGDKKVFIITGKMAPASQNALLKILEEPPAGVYFIIITEHREQLLDTIISRCMPIELKPLPTEAVENFLLKKFPDASGDKIKSAARCSEGNIGSAEQRMTSGNPEQDEMLEKMLWAAASCDPVLFAASSMPLEKDAGLFEMALEQLSLAFRGAFMKKEGFGQGLCPFTKQVDALAERKTSKRLAELYEICGRYALRLSENPKQNLLLACLCAELTE